MKKFTRTLVQILSLVISGLTVIIAVAVGYNILNIVFTAIFTGLAYVIGGTIAGFALFLTQYLLVIGMFIFLWLNILRPSMLIYKISGFIQMLILEPRKLFNNVKLFSKLCWLKFTDYVGTKWTAIKGWFTKKEITEATIVS